MIRIRKRLFLSLAALMVFWLPLRACGAEKKPAVVVVRLPAAAELVIGGVKSKQQTAVREFDTPPLALGKKFSYPLKAVWKAGDKEVTRETTILVKAGETTEIDLLKLNLSPPNADSTSPNPVPEAPAPKGTLSLRMPETLRLQPGRTKLIPIKVVRTHCEGPVNIRLEGLPPGVELKTATVAAGKQKVYVQAAAPANAEEKEWEVQVIGVSGPVRQEATLKIKIAK